MYDALWDTLTIEMRKKIDQVEVLEQERAILADSLGALGIGYLRRDESLNTHAAKDCNENLQGSRWRWCRLVAHCSGAC
jgi:hypothetical protein